MVKYNTLPTSEQNTPSDKAANTDKTANKKGIWKKAKKAIKQFILSDYNTGSRHQYVYPVIYGIGGHYWHEQSLPKKSHYSHVIFVTVLQSFHNIFFYFAIKLYHRECNVLHALRVLITSQK